MEVQKPIERKVIIKQYKILKKYKVFELKHYINAVPSHLIPQQQPIQQPVQQPNQQSVQQPVQQQVQQTAQRPVQQSQPQPQQVHVQPKQSQPQPQPQPQPPQPQPQPSQSQNNLSPSSQDFQLLSVKELNNYYADLRTLQAQITADKVDLQTLMHFEKPEFSCQFMEMYEPILSQQSDHFRAKEDVKSAQRCNDLEIETAKKMKQIQKYIESGKLSLQDYYNAIEVELNKLIGATKFVKTHMNNPKVLNFLVNKTKIVSKEVKEIKEMLAQQS